MKTIKIIIVIVSCFPTNTQVPMPSKSHHTGSISPTSQRRSPQRDEVASPCRAVSAEGRIQLQASLAWALSTLPPHSSGNKEHLPPVVSPHSLLRRRKCPTAGGKGTPAAITPRESSGQSFPGKRGGPTGAPKHCPLLSNRAVRRSTWIP